METNNLISLMIFSAAGMVLVPVFGLLLHFQPQFMHGIHVQARNAKVNCYLVGSLYAGVFLLCGLLLLLKTCNCLPTRRDESLDDITKRNERYKLSFADLESKEFVRAMEAMDRRTIIASMSKKSLDLPTTFPVKAFPV
ncbi:unnamed protein product [Peronospora belbahrii]|uniref:Transmembrane protein n=1 Tax=Peronospora belbahrii TaxID=622444 RepID=A0AAU9KHK3_9STRA|nr:unnamed protein product [Peronospora belbahrii]